MRTRLFWGRCGRFGTAALALLGCCFLVPSGARGACAGDCSGDEIVSVDELVLGVNIALGLEDASRCPAIDQGDAGVTVDDLVRAVAAAVLNGCPIFPADYRDSYTLVRDCRNSVAHGGVAIRVYANDIAARPYLDGANPLPEGSIVVKEEFSGLGCDNDDELVRWRPMRKEEPGFDPEDGDWHWQWVDRGGQVRFNDKTTCISCHVAPDCLARDHMCTVGEEGDLQLILEEQPGALLSVAGASATDVYAVGADPGDGSGPMVLHYDGERWQRLATGATGDLWWISVTPIDGSFYMAGGGGLILEYDLTERRFIQHETPGDPTLFGIWGAAENDLWAVGADSSGDGVVWHYDGKAWTVADLSGIRKEGIPALNKVWGRSASEVYAVGATGIILLFDGANWSEVDNPSAGEFLFTVHGNDDVVVATGGFVAGSIVEKGDGPFVDRTPEGALQANGVFIAPDGTGIAVGQQRSTILRSSGDWALHDSVPRDLRDYHGAWIDPDGGFWAVGGDLVDLERGILGYGGTLILPRVVESMSTETAILSR